MGVDVPVAVPGDVGVLEEPQAAARPSAALTARPWITHRDMAYSTRNRPGGFNRRGLYPTTPAPGGGPGIVANMVLRIALVGVALLLCLPLVHFANEEWGDKPQVDFNSPEWAARAELITRARVMVASPPDIRTVDLSQTPTHPIYAAGADPVECRYVAKQAKATTAKFDCALADGTVLKVKYGWTPEKYGEVAATRLVSALGFGADQVTLVERLRCIGCPPFPFEMQVLAESFYATGLLDRLTSENRIRNFTWVAVEKKMEGRGIEVDPHEGWDWNELERIDPSKGGASRAEADALRLTAMFLSHWDNKFSNQRLICEEREGAGDDPLAQCDTPFLIMQDLGATFGPTKVELKPWRETRIWDDVPGCVIGMEEMPYRGGYFTSMHISEEGRALLASKLTQLSDAQITGLFTGAKFKDVPAWVAVFKQKVREIADRTCPAI